MERGGQDSHVGRGEVVRRAGQHRLDDDAPGGGDPAALVAQPVEDVVGPGVAHGPPGYAAATVATCSQ